ncbi:MAG: transcriptional repressor NrdR, partial [Planctomycetaceae bacterium]|nr:transcriptional repressor NrdR [Planctomycetaceae bacterium]
MQCPFCKADNDKVVDSRSSDGNRVVRRRRECVDCGRRFTTYEKIEELPLRVIKKDGSREDFDRAKIMGGIRSACHKRPVSDTDIEAIVNGIETDIEQHFDREVPATYVGEQVMNRLRELDKVAYVRFASVYREFKDPSDFARELE